MMFEPSSHVVDPGRRIRAFADEVSTAEGYDAAEKKLATLITQDPTLVSYAVAHTARDEIRMSMAVRRQRIVGAVEKLAAKQAAPKTYSKESCEKVTEWGGRYLSWPLSTRKLLATATIEDVRGEARLYETTASGNARNGRFFRLVEKNLVALNAKPFDKVGTLLDDNALAGLMAKAVNEK